MVKEKLKGLSKDALIYGAGDALGRMIGLIMLPILSRVFRPADYGAIDLLQISYAFTLALLTLGVPSGVQRFYFRGEASERKTLVTSGLVFLVVVGIAGGAVIATFAETLSRAVSGDPQLLRNAILLLAIQIPIEQIWTYQVLLLRMERRAVTFSMANIGMVVTTPSLTYLFVVTLDLGLTGVFLSRCIALILVTLVLVGFTRQQYSGSVRPAVMLDVVRFAIPGHPGHLIRQSMTVLPRYLLAAFAPLTAVGLFGIAARVGSLMRIFVEAFNRAWNPFAYSNEGATDEPRIYEIVLKMMFACLVVLATTLSVLAPEVLAVLTPAGYEGAAILIPGILLYMVLDGLVLILSPILYTRNRVRWSSYLGLLNLCVLVVVGLVLVPRYHAKGLVVALVASSLVHFVAYVLAALRLFRFSVPARNMTVVVLVAAIAVLFTRWLDLSLVLMLAVKFGVIAGVSLLAMALMLRPAERDWLRGRMLRSV